jgi:hypothetical protein
MSSGPAYVYLYGGAIGETLYGIDVARALHEQMPQATLVFLSTRSVTFARELVEALPYASWRTCSKGDPRSWLLLLRLAAQENRVAVHQPVMGAMSWWWKIILFAASRHPKSVVACCAPKESVWPLPRRARVVGFSIAGPSIFETIPRMLEAWGCKGMRVAPHLPAELYGKAPSPEPVIVLHLFGGLLRRSVSASQGTELLATIAKAFPHHLLVLTCASHEEPLARAMAAGTSAEVRSNLSAREAVSLLVSARAYVGVDTGMTHLAAHLGVPAVVLGHYANDSWMPTYSPTVRLVRGPSIPGEPYTSMHAISGARVATELAKLLG